MKRRASIRVRLHRGAQRPNTALMSSATAETTSEPENEPYEAPAASGDLFDDGPDLMAVKICGALVDELGYAEVLLALSKVAEMQAALYHQAGDQAEGDYQVDASMKLATLAEEIDEEAADDE